jgi:hypothetical protein
MYAAHGHGIRGIATDRHVAHLVQHDFGLGGHRERLVARLRGGRRLAASLSHGLPLILKPVDNSVCHCDLVQQMAEELTRSARFEPTCRVSWRVRRVLLWMERQFGCKFRSGPSTDWHQHVSASS